MNGVTNGWEQDGAGQVRREKKGTPLRDAGNLTERCVNKRMFCSPKK